MMHFETKVFQVHSHADYGDQLLSKCKIIMENILTKIRAMKFIFNSPKCLLYRAIASRMLLYLRYCFNHVLCARVMSLISANMDANDLSEPRHLRSATRLRMKDRTR
jgi:hypothetical protein